MLGDEKDNLRIIRVHRLLLPLSPSPPKTGSLNYYFSVQKVPFRRYSDSIKNIRGAEVLQNEVSDDSVHFFRFGSRKLPTRANYKSQTRHSTDPFYDGPVAMLIPYSSTKSDK
jgi:hypothetical protein